MPLWKHWWIAISRLRPAFSRTRTFFWFALSVMGMTVRIDTLGVTSIVRALQLDQRFYPALRKNFHTAGVNLDALTALWSQVVLTLFSPLTVNGRLVLVGDGIKVAKSGKKMPGVKKLHQQSDSNAKPEWIMGHSMQAVCLLVNVAETVMAVPLGIRIHEGVVESNRDKRTLLDKMLILLEIVGIRLPYYFVADAYYGAYKTINGLLSKGNHLITRMKSNSVAYLPHEPAGPRKRGRPRAYGEKILLRSELDNTQAMQTAASPVYSEQNVTIQYRVFDLLWRPAGRLVRFVLVVHPTRGRCILMSTDTSLSGLDIISLYGRRFKIEFTFKQAVHQIGTFCYHFWVMDMKPKRRGTKNQYLHRETKAYRDAVRRKLSAYHLFIHVGVVAQGLQQYLSAIFPHLVWNSFGSWLRTIRPGIPPSEFVVANALRRTLPEFLLATAQTNDLAKFVVERQDPNQMGLLSIAA